jgi:hypothetical protein
VESVEDDKTQPHDPLQKKNGLLSQVMMTAGISQGCQEQQNGLEMTNASRNSDI